MLRLICGAVVALNAMAIAVAQFQPRALDWKPLAEPLACFDGGIFDPLDDAPRFLDPMTGLARTYPFPGGEGLDHAVCSPWYGDGGTAEVTGRWIRRDGSDGELRCDALGLARFELPSGRVLDRVTLEHAPDSPPAWSLVDTRRILYAAGDGRLYTFRFGDDKHPGDTHAQLVTWACALPDDVGRLDDMYVADLCRPALPGCERFVLASLRTLRDGPRSRRFGAMRLWWLKLADDDVTIVEAGPLSPHIDDTDASTVEHRDARRPRVARLADGGFIIAYLTGGHGRHSWNLAFAELDLRGDHPTQASPYAIFSGGFAATAPAFSIDATSVFVVVDALSPEARIHRLDVPPPPRFDR